MRNLLIVNILCMAGIAVTSYSQARSVYEVHVVFASLLAASQLILTAWILRQKNTNAIDYTLAISFATIVVISVLPIVRDIPGLRSYPLREVLAFICGLGIISRASFRALTDKPK